MDHQFRNAAFGGFNKQDVLDYLELTSREHREQLQQLQAELDQTQQRCSDLLRQQDQHDAQVKTMQRDAEGRQQQTDKVQTQLEQTQAQLTQAQQEQEALRGQLAEKDALIRQLQQQVDKLRPDAEAYTAVKERSAGMELDAHRRAQGILDQANAEAQQLQNQVKQWLDRVQREYSDLRTQVDATVSHAAGELEKVGKTLDQITQCLAQQDTALEDLDQLYTDRSAVKIPAPLPIPEE